MRFQQLPELLYAKNDDFLSLPLKSDIRTIVETDTLYYGIEFKENQMEDVVCTASQTLIH